MIKVKKAVLSSPLSDSNGKRGQPR